MTPRSRGLRVRSLGGVAAAAALLAAVSARAAVLPDSTFSSDGKLISILSWDGVVDANHRPAETCAGVAVQPDGKIVVAGSAVEGPSGHPDFAVARYNVDGSFDTTFNGTGKVLTNVGAPYDWAYGMALQGDGKVIVTGVRTARYNTDGSLDTSFDGDGIAASDGVGVVVQGDGKLLLVNSNSGSLIVRRYNGDGSPDTSFGVNAVATASGINRATGIALQSDGRIVATGNVANYYGLAVARFNSDGSLDTSFGGTGEHTEGTDYTASQAIAVQADGKILVGGSYQDSAMLIVRLNADGSRDTSFDGDGLATIGGGLAVYALVQQDDGKIVAGGVCPTDKFCMARLNPDGSPDTSFDGDGLLVEDFFNPAAVVGNVGAVTGLAWQANGKKIVAVGSGFYVDFGVARYLTTCGDGNVDAPTEQCDDGNATDGDGCDHNCTTTACDNGVQTAGEACDDGNLVSGDGCDINCTATGCGNGVQTIGELCDDGNATNGDGCDDNCTPTACGNGAVSSPETCDDGNLVSGDGCDADCHPTTCGNGIAGYGRQCDATASGGASCLDECDSNWTSAFSTGVHDVRGFAVLGGNLVAGGLFTTGDGGVSNGVAVWNGSAWSGLGSGIDGEVYAVASNGTTLYVGGSFGSAGGVSADSVAQWNGSAWSGLGSGVDADVLALVADGADLYAGGDFTTAGGNAAAHVAKWNGSSWSALGSGLDGSVYALALNGSDLYAGGSFANAGASPAANIARWDGAGWSALGTGTPSQVNALAVLDDDVYAVGNGFAMKWDGASWSSLGSVGSAELETIAVVGDSLYVGGHFPALDGSATANIARWDGSHWLSLGSGTSAEVKAIGTNGASLFTAGVFDTAGGKAASSGVAVWQSTACGEQCDDGNGVEGDGCDSNCTVSACGNGVVAPGEPCDDGNRVNGDGCDSNCTPPGCGNGIASPATGEQCDDGNLVGGDGCETNCTLTPFSQTVGAGATVNTDLGTGATEALPIQTSINTPNAGTISIAPPAAPATQEGFVVVGVQLEITAPPATAADPLAIAMTVDASLIPPGVDPSRLGMTRDGVAIGDCTGAAGTASPDPCIQSRTLLADGDVRLSVLTSHASLWSVVVQQLSKDQQKCVFAMNVSGVKLNKAQAKAGVACLSAAAAGTEPDAQTCLTADVAGKVGKAADKVALAFSTKCSASPPPFGLTSDGLVIGAASSSELDLLEEVFGASLNASVIGSGDPTGAQCQLQILKAVHKLAAKEEALFLKCKKNGMAGRGTPILSIDGLTSCLTAVVTDAGGSVAKVAAKIGQTVSSKCPGVTLSTAFPGSCATAVDLQACLRARVTCRVCRQFNAMDGTAANCDAGDDGVLNGSCS